MTNTQTEYDVALQQYNDSMKTTRIQNKKYFKRINPTNRFLNKTVRFSDGMLAYVTNQGYLKTLSTQKLSDYSNIPKTVINLGIKWDPVYETAGTILPSNPQLVVGTSLIPGKSVGNEGNNVQFTNFRHVAGAYQGCHDTDSLKFIGTNPSTDIIVKNGDFATLGNPPANWTLTNTSMTTGINAVASSSNYSTGLTGKNSLVEITGTQGIQQQVTIPAAGTYLFTFYYCGKRNGTNNTLDVSVSGTNKSVTTTTNNWSKGTMSIQMNNSGSITISIVGKTAGLTIAIQDISLARSGDFTHEECRKSALYQGQTFYGLHGYNEETQRGFCAVADTLAVTGPGTRMVDETLFTTRGDFALMKYNGYLQTGNSSMIGGSQLPSNYIGCYYVDIGKMTVAKFPRNSRLNAYQNGNAAAVKNNHKFYLLNESNTQCFTSNTLTDIKKRISRNKKVSGSYIIGTYVSYAVYVRLDATPELQSETKHFFLKVNDNSLTVNLGADDTDDHGPVNIIFSTNTILIPNPEKASGSNILSAGSRLTAGNFIGSRTGKLWLTIEGGKLVLKTRKSVSNCTKTSTNFFISNLGSASSAVYKLNDIVKDFKNKITQLAYIDSDSNLYPYDDANIAFVKNSYKSLSNAGFASGVGVVVSGTDSQCRSACDASDNCVGYSYSKRAGSCNLLTNDDVTTNGLFADSNYYFSMKDKIPKTTEYGITKMVAPVDSAVYTGYNTGATFTPDKVGWTSADDTSGINTQADNLLDETGDYEDNIRDVQQQYKTNNNYYKEYAKEHDSSEVIKTAIESDNYMKIVEDSEMAVLQKNTTYLVWGILATGTVLISMSMIRN
jgi:hypothetical protein